MTKSHLFKLFICMIVVCSLDVIMIILFSITPLLGFFIGAGLGVIATIAAMIWNEYA